MPRSELPRRGFLARLAAATAAATGFSAIAPHVARADAAEPDDARDPSTASPDYDDTWTRRVAKARHKAVFDGPDVADGLPLLQPWIWRAGYQAALGHRGAGVVPVVVLRHLGTALALDDAMWEQHGIGANRKIMDPATKQPAVRNPWARRRAGEPLDPQVRALLGDDVDPTVDGLVRSGAVVLTCELAMKSFARGIAARTSGDYAAILAGMRAAVIPGVVVQPSGVYAATRAQEVGATFMRSQ